MKTLAAVAASKGEPLKMRELTLDETRSDEVRVKLVATGVCHTHTFNSKNEDAVAKIREITGAGANYALDTTGNAGVFAQMTKALAILGHGALVGAAAPGTESPFDIGNLLLTGINISMVIEGDAVPQAFIPS